MSRTNPTRISISLPVLLCVALLLVGCDTSLTIEIGAIRVEVTAIGNNIDPDGYTIRVTGNGEDQSQSVEVNGQVLFAVPAGRYTVELTDKASNCVVELNPQEAQVAAGQTAILLFNTLCG